MGTSTYSGTAESGQQVVAPDAGPSAYAMALSERLKHDPVGTRIDMRGVAEQLTRYEQRVLAKTAVKRGWVQEYTPSTDATFLVRK